MIQSKTILASLPNVLKTIDIPEFGKKHQGKVRDFYFFSGKRIIITTDRQSAFNINLGFVPYKGAVLNSLAAFWFDKTKKITPNHIITIPDPNVTIAKNCQAIPLEVVVRGYLTGVTKTSPWGNYKSGERIMYGIKFPDGLRKNQKLSQPILTPTTHGTAEGSHADERLTRNEILQKKIVSKKLYKQIEEASFALFDLGSKLCEKQGLILVDTKYEFGLYNGRLTIIDEIHTPDSSRFWIKKTYQKRFEKGLEPENYDKEFLRLWYAKKGYTGDGKPPKMTKSLITALAKRYIGVYEKITGNKFSSFDYPIEERIRKNLQDTEII